MPTRTNYLMDPEYAEKCRKVFGRTPDKPSLELFIPDEFRTPELVEAICGPIWRLEYERIWPHVAELLRRNSVKGDLLEFGVFGGGSFSRLIEIFRPLGLISRYYGFDSFKGLPKADFQHDVPFFWHEGAFSNTSKEGVLKYLRQRLGDDLSDVELVEGWFSDTLPTLQNAITQVAFVRVDCDLYNSTRDVFNFLPGRLADGAIIYFDDWTHEARTGEPKAFFEFAEREEPRYEFERLLTVSDGALAVRVTTRRKDLPGRPRTDGG